MSEVVLATALFYTVTLVCGITLIVLGYRLFMAGILGPNARLTGSVPGANGVVEQPPRVQFDIQNVAPGTAFAILGAVVVVVGLWQGPPALEAAGKKAENVAKDKANADAKQALADTAKYGAEAAKAQLDRQVLAVTVAGGGGGGASTRFPAFAAPSPVPPSPIPVSLSPVPQSRPTLRAEKARLESETARLKRVEILIAAVKNLAAQKDLSQDERKQIEEWFLDQPALGVAEPAEER